MLALEARNLQFIFTGLALTVAARQCSGSVRSAARDAVHVGQPGFGIGHTDDNHAVVQQRGMKTRNGGFLAAVLRAGRSKHATNFSDQRTLAPQSAGLVEEIAHLGSHVSKTRWSAEN